MSIDLIRAQTPEEKELVRKLAELTVLEGELAQRELDLATLQAELHAFERRYLRIVGIRYAELDEIDAQIAGALAEASPKNSEAQERAFQARTQANESAQASKIAQQPGRRDKFTPSDALKKMYREVAKCIHPDLAIDENDRVRRQRFMAEANQAYEDGDEARLREILCEWESSPESVEGDGVGAELVRVIRKVAQIERRLQAIESIIARLRSSDLFRLKVEVERREAEERDLLAEMASRLDQQIADARRHLASLQHERFNRD
jgi:CII-binding regulator of phage lambda lysogenization HflD